MWSHIQNLTGRTLKTLDRGNAFDIVSVGSATATVRPLASGIDRTIEREAFEQAFTELRTRGELSRTDIQKKYSSFNPAYVASMLAQVPGVSVKTRPIRLFYRKP